jgi:WD40 repeat protein
LVGHANKVTTVRFIGNGKALITASADRCIKLWDISRSTYRQSTTFLHSSMCQSLDVSITTSNSSSFVDATTQIVSGHADGGIRAWDLRTAEHSLEIREGHVGGVTSIFLDPTSHATRLVTHGRFDHTWNVWDLRKVPPSSIKTSSTSAVLQTWKDDNSNIGDSSMPSTSLVTATAMSPDGQYVASTLTNTTTTGKKESLEIWRIEDGQRIVTASYPAEQNQGGSLIGIAWGGGSGGGEGGNKAFSSQLVSVDQRGQLTIWA